MHSKVLQGMLDLHLILVHKLVGGEKRHDKVGIFKKKYQKEWWCHQNSPLKKGMVLQKMTMKEIRIFNSEKKKEKLLPSMKRQ